MREEVKKNVCANEKMKSSLQYGAIYGYTYVGSDNVEIARFEIDRNDCGFANVQVEQNIQKTTPSRTNNAEEVFQHANDLYSQGRFAEAFPLYQQLAKYSGAQISLGGMYESGNGVTKDNNQAIYWYRKAAEIGDENEKDARAALNKLISTEKNETLYQVQAKPVQTQQTKPSSVKKVKKANKNRGDLRNCLSLGSNEAIAQCVGQN